MDRPDVLTVGHSTHTKEAFVHLLEANAVGALADVRAHPGSRRVPHFNREELERWLGRAGVDYAHLPELGGRRRPAPDSSNGGWKVGAFRAYADHMASDEFARGIERLEALARERRTAIMCAEALWWRCHRRLVSDALTVRGWRVVHVAADGSATEHALPDFAVVDGDRLSYPPAQTELRPG